MRAPQAKHSAAPRPARERNKRPLTRVGTKAEIAGDAANQLAEIFAKAPKLIPLDGHRYLPETPLERCNPVFSVHQSDVIHFNCRVKRLSEAFKLRRLCFI